MTEEQKIRLRHSREQRRYYLKHREEKKAKAKAYYWRNRERILEQKRKDREDENGKRNQWDHCDN